MGTTDDYLDVYTVEDELLELLSTIPAMDDEQIERTALDATSTSSRGCSAAQR